MSPFKKILIWIAAIISGGLISLLCFNIFSHLILQTRIRESLNPIFYNFDPTSTFIVVAIMFAIPAFFGVVLASKVAPVKSKLAAKYIGLSLLMVSLLLLIKDWKDDFFYLSRIDNVLVKNSKIFGALFGIFIAFLAFRHPRENERIKYSPRPPKKSGALDVF